MNVNEAIIKCQPIRAFKPDPVLQDILKKIIECVLRVPSASNNQPCEYAVVSGDYDMALKLNPRSIKR